MTSGVPVDASVRAKVSFVSDMLRTDKGQKGKVTARYKLDCGGGSWIECVRVRVQTPANSVVLHFSKEEFDRLFELA